MVLNAHAQADQVKRRLERCGQFAALWSGIVYRSASVAYANRDDLLTGAGARHVGARWNPPNSMATVYSALDIRTATEESLAHHRYFGFPLETALPRVMISIRVSLQRVLDLTEQRLRRTLGINRGQLLGEDWRACNAGGNEALTQVIGRLAWVSQWEAMLVPSAAEPKGVNLIIFPGNLLPPESYLLIINRDQLPPKAMPTR